MAPHLLPIVIAAIEAAVEVNDGVLESAYIHSLAKIYKTSPQAVVWNMKRYNKVKANCDDRQKGGRPSAMDKEAAAEVIKQIVQETPGMKMEKIAAKLFERFGVQVSTTWVSRTMKRYQLVHKTPAEPKIKKVRIPKPTKPVKGPSAPQGQTVEGTFATPQYQLPPLNPAYPPSYPSFRQDLQHAVAAAPRTLVNARPLPVVPNHNEDLSVHANGPLFGMLKLGRAPPMPAAPVPKQYQYQPPGPPPQFYNPAMRYDAGSDSESNSEMESDDEVPPQIQQSSAAPLPKQPEVEWQVMRVVQCG